jgi:hypothetical protein
MTAKTGDLAGEHAGLVKRLGARRESVYDYATKGSEWQRDELCCEAADVVNALCRENAELQECIRELYNIASNPRLGEPGYSWIKPIRDRARTLLRRREGGHD